jgi:hypothetical protein
LSRDNHPLHGRVVWIEFDPDHSGPAFSPRKGVIVHVFKKPLEREAIAVELTPRAIVYFPYPHRVTHVLLQYHLNGNESISDTFRRGVSYSTIYELKNKNSLTTGILTKKDLSRLGGADIFDWPKPPLLTK